MNARLTLGPEIARGRRLSVTLDGREIPAFEGESVAAVLFAEGVAATRRTRGGAPRGVFCGMGVCFDCLVTVDEVPNTRACVTWVRDGMVIERQDETVTSSSS
jgi:predicted molibdopterin-dependent oxidoreductase YjgC